MNRGLNKNMLIGILIGAVCIMAVAYAAFSTQLTINASSSIDSVWDVRYDTSATTNYVVTNGVGGTVSPTTTASLSNPDVSMSFIDEATARLSAQLYQPGDSVVFTLTVRNEGTLKASLSKSGITPTGCTVTNNTCSNGHIKYTVGDYSKTTLLPKNGSTVDIATIQVTAEFLNDETIYVYTEPEEASIDLTLNAIQDRS